MRGLYKKRAEPSRAVWSSAGEVNSSSSTDSRKSRAREVTLIRYHAALTRGTTYQRVHESCHYLEREKTSLKDKQHGED